MNESSLRRVFFSKYNVDEFLSKELYDKRDVDRVKNDDLYVKQFIRTYESLDDAAVRLHEALKWRKESKINDLQESFFEPSIWEIGGLFFHSHDKDGRKILYLRVKEHKRDAEKLVLTKLFLALHLEMAYKEDPKQEIVVLFDMMGAGMANLDMDLIKYVITCFKIYYPAMLGYMLVFEMPWLFNAAWKVVKTWLSPQAVQKMKFVSRNDIQEYIDKDKLLEKMGGTDTFQYKYIPLEERNNECHETTPAKKKVTFADQDNEPSDDDHNTTMDSPVQGTPKSNLVSRRSPNRGRQGSTSSGDNSFVGRLLTISPADELEFVLGSKDKESKSVIYLKNTLPYPIAFKVKTTSPEKYKVRPSSGVVTAGNTVEVFVFLQIGYQATFLKDKFLIMAMELTGDTENVSEKWRKASSENIMEHKLRCVLSTKSAGLSNSFDENTDYGEISLMKKVSELVSGHQKLERNMTLLILLQLFLVFLFIALILALLLSGQPTNNFCPAV